MAGGSKFTPLYDWVMADERLSLLDGLIVGRVLRWGGSGCYESNTTLAKAFNTDRRTVIRAIKRLVKLGWLAPLYQSKGGRILYVCQEKLTAGPLFDKKSGDKLSRPPKKVVSNCHYPPVKFDKSGDKLSRPSVKLSPVVVSNCHPIRDIRELSEKRVSLKLKKARPSVGLWGEAFDSRRREQISRLKAESK
ncbi:MAG TPA: helix-turn-helix domain-containing protein [Planctomycetes bacterium]|nr:helix-turn-helix domain-containing protein [Planctomycetota bacterium]HIJ70633.1 helix-turn-helix domain-containing protein [Planctomycetota bacterium]